MPLVGGISHPAGAAGPAGATGSTGAQGNPGGTIATNGSITSGAAVLTSAANPFTAAMAGCTVVVSGAGAAGADLITTILTYTNAGSVTLAANAGTTKTANAVISVNLAKGAAGATGSTGATGPQGTMAGTIAVNGSITSGAAVLTSASNPFTAAMVGCTVSVIGAGAAGGTLVTTIQTFTNAGSVTLAANAGTTVTGTGVIQVNLATGATGPAGPQGASVATNAPSDNLLLNGGFERWGNGTSFAGMANNQFGADYWQFAKGGAATLTMAQEATIVDPLGSRYSAKLTYVQGTNSQVKQSIALPYELRGRTLSVTVMVYTATPNAVRLSISDSIAAGVASPFHPGTSAWVMLTAQKVIASNSTSVTLNISLEASATVYVDSAMLVIGSVPSSFIPDILTRPYNVQDHLALAPITTAIDVTGDGLPYQLTFGAPVIDKSGAISGNFFVVPEDGVYEVMVNLSIKGLSSSHVWTTGDYWNGVSSLGSGVFFDNPWNRHIHTGSDDVATFQYTLLTDPITAGTQIGVRFYISGGARTVDVQSTCWARFRKIN